MQPADLLKKEDHRLSGRAECPQAKVPSYQELLDEALESTFPASDPIAASAAMHVHEPHTSTRDAKDWTLKPGACPPAGCHAEDDGSGSALAEPAAATIVEPFSYQVDGGSPSLVPAGPCIIEQTADYAILHWREGGTERSLGIPVEEFKCLLADGQIRREEPA